MPYGPHFLPNQNSDNELWRKVEQIAEATQQIKSHFGELVGLVGGGAYRWELGIAAQSLLPRVIFGSDRSLTLESFSGFHAKYKNLEAKITDTHGTISSYWIIDGVNPNFKSLSLDEHTSVRKLTPDEIAVGLEIGVINVPFFATLLPKSLHNIYAFCLVTRSSKTINEKAVDSEITEDHQKEYDKTVVQLQACLGLLGVTGHVKGRFTTNSFNRGIASDLHSGIGFVELLHSTFPGSSQLNRKELLETWKLVGATSSEKSILTASLRLFYSAQRSREEDALLDIAIAAEALYLASDLGDIQGELSYRLALRAGVWSEEKTVGRSKNDIRKLMKTLYNLRSDVAHGTEPDPKDLKLYGKPASLFEINREASRVIRAGLRRAMLETIKNPAKRFQPNWESLIL